LLGDVPDSHRTDYRRDWITSNFLVLMQDFSGHFPAGKCPVPMVRTWKNMGFLSFMFDDPASQNPQMMKNGDDAGPWTCQAKSECCALRESCWPFKGLQFQL